MKTFLRAGAVVLSWVCATACSTKPPPEKVPDPSPVSKSADKTVDGAVAKADAGPEKPRIAALVPIPGFDPMEGCSGPIEPRQIPPVPVRGIFIKDQGTELTVPFDLKAGRVELHKDRVLIRLASEPLRDCSPFLQDGGLATKTRIGVRLNRLATGTFRFPDEAEEKQFRYWNYVYTAERDMPMTMNAFSTEDSGTVVIESIDEEKQIVIGKLLLCKANGKKGWAVGNFEIPLCDKRSPIPIPGDEIDPAQSH